MARGSRFLRPSACLSLSSLLRKGQRGLWMGCVAALGVHFCLAQWRVMTQEERSAKPLTTQFVKRQPRLTKPLELKKRPQPKRRHIQREMVTTKARLDLGGRSARFEPALWVRRLARPEVRVEREGARVGVGEEPRAVARAVEGSKEFEHKVDMTLELLNVDALDTGRFRAMVIMDTQDRRNIRGFLHLALVYPPSMMTGPLKVLYTNWSPTYTGHLIRLCEAMNKYTSIETDLRGIYTFDQEEVLGVPWVMLSAYTSFALTASETESIGRYLVAGGFLFADVINRGAEIGRHYTLPMDQSLRALFKESLSAQGVEYGRDWVFERIANDHALYHCYFDFDNGPPMAGDTQYLGKMTFDYLEAVPVGTRMAGTVSNKFFLNPWANLGMWANMDPTRCLQFGVNLLVFALTQEGSITHQAMSSVE